MAYYVVSATSRSTVAKNESGQDFIVLIDSESADERSRLMEEALRVTRSVNSIIGISKRGKGPAEMLFTPKTQAALGLTTLEQAKAWLLKRFNQS